MRTKKPIAWKLKKHNGRRMRIPWRLWKSSPNWVIFSPCIPQVHSVSKTGGNYLAMPWQYLNFWPVLHCFLDDKKLRGIPTAAIVKLKPVPNASQVNQVMSPKLQLSIVFIKKNWELKTVTCELDLARTGPFWSERNDISSLLDVDWSVESACFDFFESSRSCKAD